MRFTVGRRLLLLLPEGGQWHFRGFQRRQARAHAPKNHVIVRHAGGWNGMDRGQLVWSLGGSRWPGARGASWRSCMTTLVSMARPRRGASCTEPTCSKGGRERSGGRRRCPSHRRRVDLGGRCDVRRHAAGRFSSAIGHCSIIRYAFLRRSREVTRVCLRR